MSNVNLSSELILGAINANLNLQFFVEPRDIAKALFNDLVDGKRAPFMNFQVGKKGDIRCDLELDTSEHIGKLNYGKFRKSVALMMMNIKQRIENKEDLSPLTNETGEMLFNIPSLLESDGDINILVCSFRQLAPGLACVRLMYLEPTFYAQAANIEVDELKNYAASYDNA